MFICSDNNSVIVDIGTETYKIGYSDKEYPMYFNSSKTFKNQFLSPVFCSTITNIDSYMTLLKDNLPKDTSYLLVCENTFENESVKNKLLAEIMEENLASSVIFFKSAILDTFSYSKTTALVLSFSGGSSQIVSVVEGYVTYRKKIDFGCENITEMYLNKIDKNKLDNKFSSFSFYANDNFLNFKKSEYARLKKEDFYLKCHDISFKHQFDYLHRGMFKILELLDEVLQNNSPDKKSALLNNIIISGGGSYINNVLSICQNIISTKYGKDNICVINHPSRFHTYFGGVLAGNIGNFKSLNIGRADYAESGVNIFKKKNHSWLINKNI